MSGGAHPRLPRPLCQGAPTPDCQGPFVRGRPPPTAKAPMSGGAHPRLPRPLCQGAPTPDCQGLCVRGRPLPTAKASASGGAHPRLPRPLSQGAPTPALTLYLWRQAGSHLGNRSAPRGRRSNGLCWLLACLMSQQHASASQTILRAATLRQKLQIELSTSPSHSILTLGRPVQR